MARDDLEYMTLTDFTPGIYSKFGASSQLGKDGAAQVLDSKLRHTFGCYPDPDGGLRPLPRRIHRYGVTGVDNLKNAAGATSNHDFHPLARGVGTGDGGRRSKVGVIDAAVHSAQRYDHEGYDSAPFRRDFVGATRPDMLHILTSYREDPVDLVTDPLSMFPDLGRLVNKWRAFSLSEIITTTFDIDITPFQRIVQTKCARYEEGSAGSGVGAATTKLSDTGSGYSYRADIQQEWREWLGAMPLHDGWASGSLAIGRAVDSLIGASATLADLDNPGRICVMACLQARLPKMAEDPTEELFPNFLSLWGGASYGGYVANEGWGYPGWNVFNGDVAGQWTAHQVPWYLIEHQDRFVGIIQGMDGLRSFDSTLATGGVSWTSAANRVRYSELNAAIRLWSDTSASPHTPATGLFVRNAEVWKYTDNNGTSGTSFGLTFYSGAPANPESDVLGNNLVERIGCMFSWQNDLVIVPMSGEGSIVRGALEDPTVIRSGTIVPTKGIVCHAVATPKGVIYGGRDGVYLWDGSASNDISPQLDGWFWDCGEASETHDDGYRRKADASMGRFGYSDPFVYAPNNWVLDLRTGAWSRLVDPDEANPYPYMHYVTNRRGDVYAVRGCYDGLRTLSPPFDDQFFVDLFSNDDRASSWRWVSQPLVSSINRELQVKEVVIIGQGVGTISVYLAGIDSDEEKLDFEFSDTARPQRIVQPTLVNATELVVTIEAEAGTQTTSAEAPTLHAVHIGSTRSRQIPQSGN